MKTDNGKAENGVCISRRVVRTVLIVLTLGAVAVLAQQAPTLWRYAKIEGM